MPYSAVLSVYELWMSVLIWKYHFIYFSFPDNLTSRCREEDEDEETTTVIHTTIAARRVARTEDSDQDRDRDIKERDLSGKGYKEFLNWSKTKDGK